MKPFLFTIYKDNKFLRNETLVKLYFYILIIIFLMASSKFESYIIHNQQFDLLVGQSALNRKGVKDASLSQSLKNFNI